MGVKPSRPLWIGSLIVTRFMLICGITVFAVTANVLRENEVLLGMTIFFYSS